MPEEGFSPDGSFPVIYAEKGILQIRLHFPLENAPFNYLAGGTSVNMVCSECSATPRTLSITRARDLGLEIRSKKVIAHGKSAHGSTPELGDNAILPILRYFEGKSAQVAEVIDILFRDKYRLTELKDATGALTFSPDIIKYRKGELHVICDIRYPATVPYADVIERVQRIGVKYETLRHQAPLLQDKNGTLVQTLLASTSASRGARRRPSPSAAAPMPGRSKTALRSGPRWRTTSPSSIRRTNTSRSNACSFFWISTRKRSAN